MPRNPAFLYLRGSVYWFRSVVPSKLRAKIGRTEIRLSLHTSDKREARSRALALRVKLENMDNDQVAFDLRLFTVKLPDGTEITADHNGDAEKERESVLAALEAVANTPKPKPTNGPKTLSEAIRAYVEHSTAKEAWTDKTLHENQAILDTALEIIGDIPLNSIGHDEVMKYAKTLQRLPANRSKLPQTRGKPIRECLGLGLKPIAVTTYNKNLTRVYSVFEFALNRRWIDHNPIQGLQKRDKRKANEQREHLTDEHLNTLLNGYVYNPQIEIAPATKLQPYMFWLIPLSMFTGARLDELCQLYLCDIRQDDGVWIFDINNNETKKIKNKSSRRVIPIHPELIRLGIVEYAQQLRRNGHNRLFPELPKTRDGYGQYASKWFARYREKCELPVGKTIHGIRHTFISKARSLDLPDNHLKLLVGHDSSKDITSRYTKIDASTLFETIKRLTYPAVDIAHLDFESFQRRAKS